MKKLFLLSSVSAMLFSCGTSQNQTATKNTKNATVTTYANSITSAELKEALYTYASDEFEGRNTGAPGQKKAVEYLKNHYVSLGIPSALPNNNYFQEVPLQTLKTPSIDLLVNGKSFTNIEDYVSVISSPDGTFDAKEIIYVGYGIDDEKFSSYANIDVKGKVVLFKAGEPKNSDGNYTVSGTNETSKWSNPRQEFVAKREVAEKKGAKAILFYNADTYNYVAKRFGGSHGRMSLVEDPKDLYYFLINTELAKTIHSTIATSDKTEPLNSTIEFNYQNASNTFTSENVVAIIKGSEKPEEYIVVSAHLDHEGIKEGEIYNGADDDGSGTVAMLEIAEAFQEAAKNGQGPKRSIVFLHVTGEEKGLLGSRYYTDVSPIFPLANTVADLNIDMIGRTDPKREKTNRNYLYLIGSDKLSTELHNISEEMNNKYCNIDLDYTFNADNDPNRFYYRSDHYNFAKNNIPVIFYFNGTHADYHKPSDTPDKIQYDLLENRTRLIFYTAWELANRENRITVDKAN
ncbi:M28 family peptidase [Lacinutrix sp. C3R15]|uniref:M28 family peptidase n=1 Tax=Flavobacteriaceae TaxID=49546 RepID=UPI001C08B11F|nr:MULTISPECIES: M28 family peptidase [Flavobacteriaceae]MBU2940567.1 M28 family peptidase [Lacinutrix sp. C3R15]MDO6623886.1 M28 family peptidase [Oceanihabitans sp. 1_MG-2023]